MSLDSLLHVKNPGSWKGCVLASEYWISRPRYHNLDAREVTEQKLWVATTPATSGDSHTNKASWRKLAFGCRQPQRPCYQKLPCDCNAFTKRQAFFGAVSHCSKIFVFLCVCTKWDYLFMPYSEHSRRLEPMRGIFLPHPLAFGFFCFSSLFLAC